MLAVVSQIMETVCLPMLPSISADLLVSRSIIQMSVPLLLLGASFSYLFSGYIADTRSPKFALSVLTFLYMLGVITSMLASHITLFFAGMFLQGLGSAYAIIILQVKSSYKANPVRVISLVFTLAVIFQPLSTYFAGLTSHQWGWRYVYLALSLYSAFVFIATFKLSPRLTLSTQCSLTSYYSKLRSITKNRYFWSNFLMCSLIMSSVYIFYVLSPYIFMHDFKLTSKAYGSLLLFVFLGILLSYRLASFFATRVKPCVAIKIGVSICLVGATLLLCLFELLPSISAILCGVFVFILGTEIVAVNARIQALSIDLTCQGLIASFFAAMLNIFESLIGFFSSHQDGETMGGMMLLLVFTAFLVNMRTSVSKQKTTSLT